jgi:hypothetical protein
MQLLKNEKNSVPIFAGEAKRNEFRVGGHRLMVHEGSTACFPPLRGTFLE